MWGQFRVEDSSDCTFDGYNGFTADGSFPLADRYNMIHVDTGTATYTLQPESFGVSGARILDANGTLLGELAAPQTSRRTSSSVSFSVSGGSTATLYVDKTARSPAIYRLVAAVA